MKTRTRTVKRIDASWLNKEVGRAMRSLRQQRGLTLAEVGIGLGVTRAAVNNWELGNQENLLLTTIYNVALFYGIAPKRLLP